MRPHTNRRGRPIRHRRRTIGERRQRDKPPGREPPALDRARVMRTIARPWTCATSSSSPMSITARRPWSTPCCARAARCGVDEAATCRSHPPRCRYDRARHRAPIERRALPRLARAAAHLSHRRLPRAALPRARDLRRGRHRPRPRRAARGGPYGNGAKQGLDKSGTTIPDVASRDPQHRGGAGSGATPFPASPSGFHRARAHRFTERPHPNSTLSASCLRSGPAGRLPTSPGSRCRRRRRR